MTTSGEVLITGTGCVCGAGLGVEGCMDALFGSPPLPAPPRRFASGHVPPLPVFEVPEEFYETNPREHLLFDTTLFALAASHEALERARLDVSDLPSLRVGVCVGTTVGAALNLHEFYAAKRLGEPVETAPLHRFLKSNPALALAERLKTTGPVQTVVNACSSGTDAIGIAAGWIRQGWCDIALAGGADELTPITYNGFASLMITDQGPCKPFDKNRSGLNLGEGAGMLVLESAASARARGAGSEFALFGYGTCADAHHLTAPRPDGAGLRSAIRHALLQSNLGPKDIGFINLHATATHNNDKAEAGLMHELFPNTALSATKGATGHTLGAAGALEAVFTLECLRRGELPPSIGCTTPDPDLPAAPVLERTAIQADAAMSQSLAFGGNNSSLIVGRCRA